jgi:hypothetical protein
MAEILGHAITCVAVAVVAAVIAAVAVVIVRHRAIRMARPNLKRIMLVAARHEQISSRHDYRTDLAQLERSVAPVYTDASRISC